MPVTENAKCWTHGPWETQGRTLKWERVLENKWELDEGGKERTLKKKIMISTGKFKSSDRAETDSLNSRWGVVGIRCHVGPGGSPWSPWRLLGREVIGSDQRSGMCLHQQGREQVGGKEPRIKKRKNRGQLCLDEGSGREGRQTEHWKGGSRRADSWVRVGTEGTRMTSDTCISGLSMRDSKQENYTFQGE